MSLTVAYCTSRQTPRFEWFFESLQRELRGAYATTPKIIVDLYAKERPIEGPYVYHVEPKPNVWQGPHRLTKDQWWAKSAALNTALCMCKTEWIAFIDDRSLILPGWHRGIQAAMKNGYAVAGSYEKVDNLKVVKALPVSMTDHKDGKDHRKGNRRGAIKAPGSWWFGCNNCCPLDWALTVNGYDETCDGMGFEDVWFGVMLSNNGFPVMYDQSMKILEDRTPGQCEGGGLKKTDKGVSPKDKSHKLVEMLQHRKTAMHQWDLRAVRKQWQETGTWPVPTGPTHDWFDGQAIKEM